MFDPNKFGYFEEAGEEGAAGGDAATETSNADAVADAVAWQWSDTVAGEGAAPEWLKGEKYKTVEAQAKAYGELEGKFGAFTGAPEDYDIKISDELKETGFTADPDDPIVQEFSKWAKESNLSQEGFNGLIEMKGMMDAAQNKAFEDHQADEMKQLGTQGQARINNINAWASANLSTEQLEGVQEMATSAKSIEVLEALIAKGRNAPISPEALAPIATASADEVKAMQFEKDSNGNRRLSTDPAFRARFNKLSQEVHGAEPARQTIG